MHAELSARGVPCCLNTVAKLMHGNDIRAKTARKFRNTTDSDHPLPAADNLLGRQFDAQSPNERWCADITYIPTREGWLYLAVVEDLFSRMVVGWSMDQTVESRLVVDALEMAIQRRRPEAGLLTIRMMTNELHCESVVSSSREGRWLMSTCPTPNLRPSWATCRVVETARFSASEAGCPGAKLCASSST